MVNSIFFGNFLLVAIVSLSSSAQAQRKNVIMITSDSMDGRVLDPLQHIGRAVQLPNLRKLAESGTNFLAAYSHSPVCGPSRASALTSRFVHETGTWNNYQELYAGRGATGLDENCCKWYGCEQCARWAAQYPVNATFFDAFEDAGYDIAAFGKIDAGANLAQRYGVPPSDHTGPETRTVPRGADILLDSMAWNGWQVNSTDDRRCLPADCNFASNAASWLHARPASSPKPFFLYVGINTPHEPFITGPRWLETVNTSEIHTPYWPTQQASHPYDWHMTVSKGCTGSYTYAEKQQLRAVYLAMCASADALHGEVLAAAEAAGHLANTVVVFWSDHGEMAFEARQVLKDSFREPSVRVPLIFSGPGIVAGRRVAMPASLLDVWPTLAELVGIAAPPQARGYSLAPYMALEPRTTGTHPDYVVGEFFAENSNTGAFMLRQGDFKYIAYGHSFPWFASYHPQLFNVSADPLEKTDLAATLPDVVAAMDQLLITALGQPYQHIDTQAMVNDQFVFRQYLSAGKTLAQLRTMFEDTYKNFADSHWQQVLRWNSTQPTAHHTSD